MDLADSVIGFGMAQLDMHGADCSQTCTGPKGTPSQASVGDPGVDGLASVQEWLEPERS